MQSARSLLKGASASPPSTEGTAALTPAKFRYTVANTPRPSLPSPQLKRSPVASTSSKPISTPRAFAVKKDEQEEDVKSLHAGQHSPPAPVQVSPTSNAKGKGKEKEREDELDHDIVKRESEVFGGPSKSLLNRLSGPSDGKAGLGYRDPEEVKRIIYETSKNSAYYKNELKKDQELQRKVARLVAKVDELVQARGGDLTKEEKLVDEMIREMEKKRDLSQTVAVVDADAFYASCHELEDPALKGTAFVVGSGVACTASYEARKYGCRSAMAGFVAKKLCPHLRVIELKFSLYTRISKQIMEILRQYGQISPASLDEAYCQLTDYCAANNVTPAEAVQRMRDQVKRETGCTVSAGVSPNAMVSKIAADLHKPDGQFVIDPTSAACIAFMNDLPVRKIPGIGRVSEQWLQGLGISKVSDIYRLRGKLFLVREEIGLSFLLKSYLGLGTTVIKPRQREQRKGVSAEQTFSTLSEIGAMYKRLRTIAESLAGDLESGSWSGRTITLKLKLDTFEVLTRSHTPASGYYFSDADTLYREGKKLLDKEISDRKQIVASGGKVKGGKAQLSIRLLGLRMSNLRDDSEFRSKESQAIKEWTAVSDVVNPKPNDDIVNLVVDDDDYGDVKLREDEHEFYNDETNGKTKDEDKETGEPRAPASSGPLWAAVGDPEWIDDHLLDEPVASERHKPFFTGGEGINSRLEDEAPVPQEDRLTFNAPAFQGGLGGTRVQALVCPVCEVSFVASEVALAHHVNSHFTETADQPSKAKRSKNSSGPQGSVKKLRTLEGYLKTAAPSSSSRMK